MGTNPNIISRITPVNNEISALNNNNHTISRIALNTNNQNNIDGRQLIAQAIPLNQHNIKINNANNPTIYRLYKPPNNDNLEQNNYGTRMVVPGQFITLANGQTVQFRPNIQQNAMYNSSNQPQRQFGQYQTNPIQQNTMPKVPIQTTAMQSNTMKPIVIQPNTMPQSVMQTNAMKQNEMQQTLMMQQNFMQQMQHNQMRQLAPNYMQQNNANPNQLQQMYMQQNLIPRFQTQVRQTGPQTNQSNQQHAYIQHLQQFKRAIPLDSTNPPQRPPGTVSSSSVGYNTPNTHQQLPVTPVQGRRPINKVTNNVDTKMIVKTDISVEAMQRNELEVICNEILSLEVKLEDIDKEMAELRYTIEQYTLELSATFKLHRKHPEHKIDPETAKLLPDRKSFNWPMNSKEDHRSIFIYKKECLRPLVLTAGRIDMPGFDVEKKRSVNINWPYPTSRPGFSITWKYQLSKVISIDELYGDQLELSTTEPKFDTAIESTKKHGCNGLSTLALCVKMLWSCLRWDDMLMNYNQNTGIPPSMPSQNKIYKEITLNGDILERRIVNWKPLDNYSSQCSFLIAICITKKATENLIVNSARSSRNGRQRTAAKYTDIDYFTDDGERDSEDSDPNFIPGQLRTGRPRGRRSRVRATDDVSESKLLEKKYREEWVSEDMLELWEIRDFLMSINWRPANAAITKQKSSVVANIISKRMFQRVDTPMPVSRNYQYNPIKTVTPVPNLMTQNMTIKSNELEKSVPLVVTEKKIVNNVSEIKPEEQMIPSDSKETLSIHATKPVQEPMPFLKPQMPVVELNKSVDLITQYEPPSLKAHIPITDIREITRPQIITNATTSIDRVTDESSANTPTQPKEEALMNDIDAGSDKIIERVSNIRQNIVEVATIAALEKSEEITLELEIENVETKKSKKSTEKESHKDKIESPARVEVPPGSVSPEFDSEDEDVSESDISKSAKSFSPRKSQRKKSTRMELETVSASVARKTRKRQSTDSTVVSLVKSRKTEEIVTNVELYCVCMTPYDDTRTYIGCDLCQNWFHFECVQMDENTAKEINSWTCDKCSTQPDEKENEQSEIYCSCRQIYDPTRLYIACDYCDDWYHPQCVGMTDDEAKNFSKKYKCPLCSNPKSKNRDVLTIDPEEKVTSGMKQKLLDLMNKIIKRKDALSFLKPVNPKLHPQYYIVVQSPMDLVTVKSNLEKSKYPTIGSLKLDMHKIFTACRIYFDYGSKETQNADSLELYFLTELKRICNL